MDEKSKFIQAAEMLAEAQVEFAKTFMMARTGLGKNGTDRQAHEMAVSATNGRVTIAQAAYDEQWALVEGEVSRAESAA